MRKQIDGLAALVRLEYGMELTEESLFLFCDTLEGAEATAILYTILKQQRPIT